MKKTFTLSISGRIFQVEEDAYALLLDYLESLSQVFKGDDGREIVADIEGRISEIFQEETDSGKAVFTLADAEGVIATIGNAAQLAAATGSEELCEETDTAGTGKETQCPPPIPDTPTEGQKRKLFRSESDKVLGGVLGGLGMRFGVSVLPLRIITVLLIFPLGFFPIFIAYCIAWAIIPLANTPVRKLEQQGRPVTVENIGEVVSTEVTQTPPPGNAATFLRVLGAICMGFLGLLAGIIGIGLLIALVVLLALLVALLCGMAIPANTLSIEAFNNLVGTWEVTLAFFTAICIWHGHARAVHSHGVGRLQRPVQGQGREQVRVDHCPGGGGYSHSGPLHSDSAGAGQLTLGESTGVSRPAMKGFPWRVTHKFSYSDIVKDVGPKG